MLLLLNSDYGAVKKILKLNRFWAEIWASRHKIYITAIFTHAVLELCKNKNLPYLFKASLTPETRIGYICNTHGHGRPQKFFQGGQSRHFAYPFQVSDDATQTDVHKTLYPCYTTKKMLSVTGNGCKQFSL